jgi:transposase
MLQPHPLCNAAPAPSITIEPRLVVGALLWPTKTGAPLRDLPERFGPSGAIPSGRSRIELATRQLDQPGSLRLRCRFECEI